MKAVFVETIGDKRVIKDVEIPQPKEGQVLVKLEATIINPSDLLAGSTNTYKFPVPYQLGFEGCGIVVKAGDSSGEHLVGRRISAFTVIGRTWAEYFLALVSECITMDEDITPEQGAGASVNPLTALGLFDVVKEKHKSVIITAAASSIGKMLCRLFKKEDIKTIAIVRSEEQMRTCTENGADVVINSTDSDFEEQVKKHAQALNATCLVDSVSGDMTNKVMRNMPFGSTCFLNGRLDGNPTLAFDADEFFFNKRSVNTFFFIMWFWGLSEERKKETYQKVRDTLKSECRYDISKTFSLEDVNEAFEFYKDNMSRGKVILKPFSK